MNLRILILAGLAAVSCRTSPAPPPPPASVAGGGIEAAIARLADPKPAVRLEAAALLAVPGAETAVAPLAERALNDDIAQVRWRALASLVRIDRREKAVAALLPGLDALDPTLRWRAAIALAMFEERAALPVLHQGVLSPDPYRRLEAITALGQVHDATTPQVLRPLLESPSENDRKEAVFALGRIGGPDAERLLIEALADPATDVRARASLALGRAGTKAALAALRAVAESDPDALVRERAAQAIRKIASRP